ncbi:MAG: radical SAM protein [Candidatus Eiseniibacteriota bacterium]
MTEAPESSRLSILRTAKPAPSEGGAADSLVVNEVYASIQGESTYAGLPCTFVRLAACHLRCVWCDTPHAFDEGVRRTVDDVIAEVDRLGHPLVEVTGGEPLLQPAVYPFMKRLCDSGKTVLLETSGSLDIGRVDPRVVRIVDFKCPGSGEMERNRFENVALLTPRDEVKFVLADRADYDWARELIARYDLASRATVLLSTAFGQLAPAEVAAWMLADHVPARLQVQLHKVIWDPNARGV